MDSVSLKDQNKNCNVSTMSLCESDADEGHGTGPSGDSSSRSASVGVDSPESDCPLSTAFLDSNATHHSPFRDKDDDIQAEDEEFFTPDEEGLSDGMEEADDVPLDYEDFENSSDQGLTLVTDKEKVDSISYQILSPLQIVQHMNESISKANEILQLPPTAMRILLNHFRWDQWKLMEEYSEGNPEQILDEIGVLKVGTLERLSGSNLKECGICSLDVPSSELFGLICEHYFCRNCWSDYLTNRIMNEGKAEFVTCGGYQCQVLIEDASIVELFRDSPDVLKRYQLLIVEGFVQSNRLMRWCPATGCENAIIVSSMSDEKPITCECDYMFCMKCGNNWHEPISCDLLKKWELKCSGDSETLNWMTVNTKPCPKCNSLISKNGGCNHMICGKPSCRAEFCWICFKPLPHYDCNRFQDEQITEGQKRCKTALDRYLFYSVRFMNNMESLKLEHKLKESVQEIVKEMLASGLTWAIASLKKAMIVLKKCRQTLTYTYAFAYYLNKNNQLLIFEDNQSNLQNATEELSGYLERKNDEWYSLSEEYVASLKQKSDYCSARRQALLDHIREGREKDWWNFESTVI